MNDAKYIGLDVHQATISVAVLDAAGNLVMEAILETKTETILQFLRGLRGSLQVAFEEGTWAAWLHDLLKPHITRVVVCDPRKLALGKIKNKNDRNDARNASQPAWRRNKFGPPLGAGHLTLARRIKDTTLPITSPESAWCSERLIIQRQMNRVFVLCPRGMQHPRLPV
jgi:hypothetical protein